MRQSWFAEMQNTTPHSLFKRFVKTNSGHRIKRGGAVFLIIARQRGEQTSYPKSKSAALICLQAFCPPVEIDLKSCSTSRNSEILSFFFMIAVFQHDKNLIIITAEGPEKASEWFEIQFTTLVYFFLLNVSFDAPPKLKYNPLWISWRVMFWTNTFINTAPLHPHFSKWSPDNFTNLFFKK